ncbi:hypothetical protein QTP70_026190, partial [Hemibagrus guttatus]
TQRLLLGSQRVSGGHFVDDGSSAETRNCWSSQKTNRLHSFIHCLPLIRSILGSQGACAYLRRHWASRQDTPWKECQPIA